LPPGIAVLAQKLEDHAASDAAAFARIDSKLNAILAQTTATNGRVNGLERSALIAETERATLQRVANKDRQHNKDVEDEATDRREAKFTRWQKFGIGVGGFCGLLASTGGLVEIVQHIH
jgi:hypothetical protein